jgi:hypothetical protein
LREIYFCSYSDRFRNLNRFIWFVLCITIAVEARSSYDVDCNVKHNVTFGPLEEKKTTCELKYVKFSAGRALQFGNKSNELTYQQLRVKFVESSIQSIPSILFDTFRNLEILELNGVGLRNIFPQSFNRADDLKVLQMYGNKMTSLPAYSFLGATNLEVVDLSSNLLTNIQFEAFMGLDNLRELSLSNNRISIIDETTFHPLQNLSWIWLDRNELKIISANLLVNSQKLEGIYLNDNKVSAFSSILLDKLPNLQFLFMINNNCTSTNFINTKITANSNVKKELAKCFEEYRTIVPEEEERFRYRNILRDAEKANADCETNKADLLKQLKHKEEELAKLQKKTGK